MRATHLSDSFDKLVDTAHDHVAVELLLGEVWVDGDHDYLIADSRHFFFLFGIPSILIVMGTFFK